MQHLHKGKLSRRAFVAKASTGAAAVLVASSATRSAARIDTADTTTANESLDAASVASTEGASLETINVEPLAPPPWELLQPLRPGSPLAEGWRVKDLDSVVDGACVLTLENQQGRTSRLHICRNHGSPTGLVHTEQLDLVVMNGGRGDLPTEEGLGQAVAEVAHAIATNEGRAASVVTALLSQEQRTAKYADTARLR